MRRQPVWFMSGGRTGDGSVLEGAASGLVYVGGSGSVLEGAASGCINRVGAAALLARRGRRKRRREGTGSPVLTYV